MDIPQDNFKQLDLMVKDSLRDPMTKSQFNFVEVNEFVEELPKLDNTNLVTLSDDNVVLTLIDNVPITSEDPLLSNTDVFLKPEPPDISPEIKTEGEQIMSQLTGFGHQSMVHHFQQMESGHQHQQNLHQMIHQNQMSAHPHQGSPQPQRHNLQQHSPSPFANQPGAVPYVKIVEQPAGNKLRFRYECEGRSAGALHGVSYNPDNKTYPSIQIVGYKGPAVVVVSCVEEKEPYRCHPHKLVGKDGMCKKGVCSMDINTPDMTATFQNLGIQCVRRKDAPASLAQREKIQVDPFKQGFMHANMAINLNAIRLCFQVFLKTQECGLVPLAPVVSNVIQDKKAHSDLQIVDYSDDSSPVQGGKKVLIFCEKVDKNDVEVHFTLYTKSGEPVTCKGEFTASGVHKQFGISFKTPKYPNQLIKEDVRVQMYLYKPSDKSTSEPVDFWYMADVSKEENRSPRPGNRRGRHNNNHDEPSSGQRIVPPKQTAQSRAIGFGGGGGGVMIMNQQNQNNEMPPTPTWNIPSQYSMLQPPQQQNRNDMIQGTDPNMYASNVYSPGDAVSPPTMATSEAPTNWHEPSKPGSTNYTPQRTHRSFTDQINSLGNNVEQTSVLNTEIIKEALANDSLTNLDLNTGDINALVNVQDDLSGQLKDSLKLESSPSKMPMNKHENKEYQDTRAQNMTDHKVTSSVDRQSSQLHTPDVSMSSNHGQPSHSSPNKKCNK